MQRHPGGKPALPAACVFPRKGEPTSYPPTEYRVPILQNPGQDWILWIAKQTNQKKKKRKKEKEKMKRKRGGRRQGEGGGAGGREEEVESFAYLVSKSLLRMLWLFIKLPFLYMFINLSNIIVLFGKISLQLWVHECFILVLLLFYYFPMQTVNLSLPHPVFIHLSLRNFTFFLFFCISCPYIKV